MPQSVTILTDTPARLRNFLIAHGVLKEEIIPSVREGPQTILVGAVPGMEWVRVGNQIITDNSDPQNPVYDTRAAFMVKFAYESEVQTLPDFRDWVLNNSSVVAAPAGWTLQGEPLGPVRKINGELVWVIHDRPERFGVWQ